MGPGVLGEQIPRNIKIIICSDFDILFFNTFQMILRKKKFVVEKNVEIFSTIFFLFALNYLKLCTIFLPTSEGGRVCMSSTRNDPNYFLLPRVFSFKKHL